MESSQQIGRERLKDLKKDLDTLCLAEWWETVIHHRCYRKKGHEGSHECICGSRGKA